MTSNTNTNDYVNDIIVINNSKILVANTSCCSILKKVLSKIATLIFDEPAHSNFSCNFSCSFIFDATGLKINELSDSKSTHINFFISATRFDYYKCTDSITISIDLRFLNNFFREVCTNHFISFYINENNKDKLYVESLNTDADNKCIGNCCELNNIEHNQLRAPTPKVTFDYTFCVPLNDFGNFCRSLKRNKIDAVEISACDGTMMLSGRYTSGVIRTTYNNCLTKKTDQLYNRCFELKTLAELSDSNLLCNTIDFNLKNDYPLCLVLGVGTLGKLRVLISPIEFN